MAPVEGHGCGPTKLFVVQALCRVNFPAPSAAHLPGIIPCSGSAPCQGRPSFPAARHCFQQGRNWLRGWNSWSWLLPRISWLQRKGRNAQTRLTFSLGTSMALCYSQGWRCTGTAPSPAAAPAWVGVKERSLFPFSTQKFLHILGRRGIPAWNAPGILPEPGSVPGLGSNSSSTKSSQSGGTSPKFPPASCCC